ncbi:hypothetical protein BGZ83_010972 [Gryganskiella cystojenkinii]|nr:hypothetical protein BGZ83_010972 [Gryganskiella cystojenkinii]
MLQGKLSKDGRPNFGVIVRNKDIQNCPVGALAFYLLEYWEIQTLGTNSAINNDAIKRVMGRVASQLHTNVTEEFSDLQHSTLELPRVHEPASNESTSMEGTKRGSGIVITWFHSAKP